MKRLLIGIMMLAMLSVASAYTESFDMKTSDFFIVQFGVGNVNNLELRNCLPYVSTGDKPLKEAFTFSPEIFDLAPGEQQVISGRIDDLPTGYYEGRVNVKCERYLSGSLADVQDIISDSEAPSYEILVTPAGEGQNYVFIPVQSYVFISKPGQTEKATFSIANTGLKNLEVDITTTAEYQDTITITPRKTSISPGERESFQIRVDVPADFEGLETNLTVNIGDYQEGFPITGEKEGFNIAGNAVSQNLLNGSISAGNIKIPNWTVILTIIIASYFLFKEEINKAIKKKTKKRGKRK